MKIEVIGRNYEVSERLKEITDKKLAKLDKYFEKPEEITANVVIRVRGKDQIVEVTIPAKKIILRGEESHQDLYAAIDLVSEKIERQMRKNKTRMNIKEIKK